VKPAATSATAAPPEPPDLQIAGPGHRPPARAVTAVLAAIVLVVVAGVVLTGLEWGSLAISDAVGNIGAEAGTIAYAALGALIVRRAGNLVGWVMLAEGAASAVMATGSAYAIFGVKAHPGTLPAAAAAGALAEGASAEQHLLSCGPCRARVTAAGVTGRSVIDFAAVWDRTRDAVEVPRPSVFERLLRGAGLPAAEARLVAVASAFRGVWLTGVAAVLVFAALAAALGHARGVWLFLAVAPASTWT
jgi:hypothetical protein